MAELRRLKRQLSRPQPDGDRWATRVERLLRHAFKSPVLADEFQTIASGGRHPFGDPAEEWAEQLITDLAGAPAAPPTRAYWSQRAGRAGEMLDQDAVMDRFVLLVGRLDRDAALWAESFGVDCPDGVGDPIGSPSDQIEELLQHRIGASGAWPLESSRSSWSLSDFFDLIEVLHDLASWPGGWSSHNYGGCIGHPLDPSPNCGQGLYRYAVNELLALSDLGVQVAEGGEDRGRVVHAHGGELDTVVDRALARPLEGSEEDIAHAIATFRSRERTVPSMRGAIVTLAGVLEERRQLLKEVLVKKDEGALFQIANEFALRHRNAGQQGDYDPAFLEWVFAWYLATINLVHDLLTSRAPTPGGTATPGAAPAPAEPF